MGVIEGLILSALAGLAGAGVAALSRSPWVPALIVGLGLAGLVILGISLALQPCTGDAAGCGMTRGFQGIMLFVAGTPLVAGGMAAAGWRLVAGRDAGMQPRIIAFLAALAGLPLLALVFVG